MIQTAQPQAEFTDQTLWGLTPLQLHDRFWAARGVQVVRQGEHSPIVNHAELYLLTAPRSLAVFRLTQVVNSFSWLKPRILFVRLHNTHEHGYTERVLADQNNRFIAFERDYGSASWRLGRVALTADPQLARQWQQAADTRSGWRALRRDIPAVDRATLSITGTAFDDSTEEEALDFVRELTQIWQRPDATIPRATRLHDEAWADRNDRKNPQPRCIGPVWIGAGRQLGDLTSVIGPTVIWDDPHHRPPVDDIPWFVTPPDDLLAHPIKVSRLTSLQRAGKRTFDIGFALFALLLTVPFYPLIMLAIWIEDGGPFFFLHARESRGGREFPCIKFRTMRKDAERIKTNFQAQNHSDGPHFFIERDPRLTRVGYVLRRFNIDEWPQFFNVLLGQMAVVGPRPSPRNENQYCPPWREARLSVRPGITGLWQVQRSRQAGLDFQEWIRYDIEYVENLSWKMDLRIILKTILTVLRLK